MLSVEVLFGKVSLLDVFLYGGDSTFEFDEFDKSVLLDEFTMVLDWLELLAVPAVLIIEALTLELDS